MISVLLVDDHEVVRAAIRQSLSHDTDIKLVGEATNGTSAIDLVQQCHPDIVILDIDLPDINGLEVVEVLKEKAPEVKVLAITGHTENLLASKLVNAGAYGYVSKEIDTQQIITAIKTVYRGQPYFSKDIATRLISSAKTKNTESPFISLSEREQRVVEMILSGMKPTDIAKKLKLSPKTVNTFRYRIFEKLGIANDVELALLAIRHKIVNIDEKTN